MVKYYTTLYNERVAYARMNSRQKSLLRECWRAYKRNECWLKFQGRLLDRKNVEIMGGQYVYGVMKPSALMFDSPIYMVIVDLEKRLGVTQGHFECFLDNIKLNAEANMDKNTKLLDEFLK